MKSIIKETEGYVHLKVKVTEDFYIPVQHYKMIEQEQGFKMRAKIEEAIGRNINGWNWSGSHVAYQRQDIEQTGKPKVLNFLEVPSGSNIIYSEDVNR